MSETFTLGKKEILGNIDFSKVKNGLSKKDLGIEEGSTLSSIFDSLDTNKDGVSKGKLDKNELAAFIQIVKKLAQKDNTLSEKEAGKFKINGEKIDKTGKELLDFLSRLSKTTDDISEVVSDGNKQIIKYNNGNIYEEEIFEDGSKFVRETSGKNVTEKVFDASGREIRRTNIVNGEIINDTYIEYDEKGNPVSKQISNKSTYWSKNTQKEIEGTTYTKYIYDEQKQDFIEAEQVNAYADAESNSTVQVYRNLITGDSEKVEIINGLYSLQERTINGKTTQLQFDEQGCLLGYVIQPGETPDSIAQKFGISKELLLRANNNSAFMTLDTIRIPKQVSIDDPAVQDMKTKEQVWEEAPKIKQTWVDPDSGKNWEEELVVTKENLKHGWKIACDKNGQQYVFTEDNKYLSDEEVKNQLYYDSLPKIEAEFSNNKRTLGIIRTGLPSQRKLACDQHGNIYIVSHDNKVLKEDYVAKKDFWDYSPKVKGKTKNDDGSYTTADYIVVKEGLPKGRKIVQDIDGKLHYMNVDGIICDEEVAKEDFLDKIRNDQRTSMEAALSIMTKMYENAKAAFDKQIKEQGWTARAADAISILWGSENRAEKVAEDLRMYLNQINILKNCLSSGDLEGFKAVFRDTFKIDFNQEALAKYLESPTEQNYLYAFGNDNNIALRVAKYNDSQNLGGSIVKAVTSAVTGIVAAAAVPISGGASSIAVGAAGAGFASALVGITDRVSSDVGLREGDIEEIAKNAAWDGASVLVGGVAGKVAHAAIKGTSTVAAMARGASNIAADTAMGVAQEYVESGEITVGGVVSNVILSGAGNVISLKEHKKNSKNAGKINHNELLVEYNQLHAQTTSGNIDIKLKAENIKRMKDIENLLEQQGYNIEQAELKKINDINTKASEPVNEVQKISKQELKTKLGNKLFELYEMIESSIEKLKTISDYNKIKTAIVSKFKDFQEVMSDLLTKLEDKATKIGLNKKTATNEVSEPVSLKSSRKERMGRRLSRYYTKIENAIDKMTDLDRFNKLLDKITTKFADFKEDMKLLIDKLYEKAKSIGLSVKESLHEVYARNGIKAAGVNPLDKYTFSKLGISMNKSHSSWMESRKDLFGERMHDYPNNCWRGYTPQDQHHGAWKMHLFSVSEADWRKMCDVIIPYLKERGVEWKTFNSQYDASYLNGSKQQGKAFTIYPKNNEDMAQIAKDLDYIIRKNKLEIDNSHITGDNQMGSTGRLFYRYEFKSGKYKDEILDLEDRMDRYKYYDRYDANRGEGRYLADDMTIEDDIWRNFDPSDPKAQPASGNSTTRKEHLRKGQIYDIQGVSRLNLANIMEIDLNTAGLRARINNLPEGGMLTIGREGDIRINDPSNKISRIHVIIKKHNGKIYIIDNSSNGTSIIRNTNNV